LWGGFLVTLDFLAASAAGRSVAAGDQSSCQSALLGVDVQSSARTQAEKEHLPRQKKY
jgi:hypothetical protein